MKRLTSFFWVFTLCSCQLLFGQVEHKLPLLQSESPSTEKQICGEVTLVDQDPQECNCAKETVRDRNGNLKEQVKYNWTDRFGNKYCNLSISKECNGKLLNKSTIPTPIPTFCQAGYFKLYFDDPNNLLPQSHRDILCQVFADLAVLIIPADPTSFVNIEVKATNNPGSNSIATASTFYNVPTGAQNAILAGEVWNAINLVANNPALYDGVITINMGYNFYTGYSNAAGNSNSGQYDLYTVVLHEALHALGFASLIDANGNSKLGTTTGLYSNFDDFILHNNVPILSNVGPVYQYNPTTALNQGCVATKFDNANSLISPIYAPTIFSNGSSLSHFSDGCGSIPGQIYVMNPSLGSSQEKRLSQEEANVLCRIGYSINNFYGTPNLLVGGVNPNVNSYTPCGAPVFLPVNDAATTSLTTCPGGNPLGIFIDLIANDIIPVGSTYTISDVSFVGNGQLNTFSILPTGIQFIANSPGSFTLKYRFLSGGVYSSFATVTVMVLNCIIPNCTPDVCGGLINNSGFEAMVGCGGGFPDVFGGPSNNAISLDCWRSYAVDPIILARCPLIPSAPYPYNISAGSVGSDSWNSVPNDHFVMLWSNVYYGISSIQQALKSSIQQGTSYTLSFRARSNPSFPDAELTVGFTPAPLSYVGSLFSFGPGITQLFPPIPVSANFAWQYFTINFTYTGPLNLSNIILGNSALGTPLLSTILEIDDINIVPTSQFTSLAIPSTICLSENISDLSVYIGSALPNGTFFGTGVTTNVTPSGTVYSFNPTVGGMHEINYSYTDVLGCVISIADYIEVLDPATIGSPSNIDATNITLTDADITWNPVTLPATGYYAIEYRAFGASTWQTGPSVAVGTNLLNLNGLVAGVLYEVRVKAYLSLNGCSSPWSESGYFVTISPICSNTAPIPTLSLYTGNSVQLNWVAVPITGWYGFERRQIGTSTWISAGTVGGGATSKNIGGLNPAFQYEFRMRAFCPNGITGPYGFANTTGQTIVPCSQSITLSMTYISGQTVAISWTPVLGVSYYEHRYKPSSSSTWIVAGTGGPNASSFIYSNLTPSTNYDFETRAFCTNGAAGVWSPINASTTALTDCELTPTIDPLIPASYGPNAITITWGNLTGVAWYEFQHKAVSSSNWIYSTGAGSITSKTFSGLTAGTNYEFKMKCNCIFFPGSLWSPVVTSGPSLIFENGSESSRHVQFDTKSDMLEQEDFDFALFPIPNDGHVFLQLSDNEIEEMTIHVTDLSSKTIFYENVAFANGKGDFELMASSGTYLVQIINPTNQAKVIRKLIIQK